MAGDICKCPIAESYGGPAADDQPTVQDAEYYDGRVSGLPSDRAAPVVLKEGVF